VRGCLLEVPVAAQHATGLLEREILSDSRGREDGMVLGVARDGQRDVAGHCRRLTEDVAYRAVVDLPRLVAVTRQRVAEECACPSHPEDREAPPKTSTGTHVATVCEAD